MSFYVSLINECGAPGATGIGFTGALTLMSQGKAAMWVDATVAAGFLKILTSPPSWIRSASPWLRKAQANPKPR